MQPATGCTLLFDHVTVNSALSPALRGVFLPHRRDVLEAFITARESGAPPLAATDRTIGARPIEAPN